MDEKSFTIPAFAKINRFLKIEGRRDDGYHEICTVFQTISLHDNLTFSECENLVLDCNDKSVPTDGRNLIIRATELLRRKYAINKGAKIFLEKKIPSPGGLGGGSSDAAAALIGLNKLWNLEADEKDLTEIAEKIGADVPFFLTGGTAAGSGKGTDIFPLEDIEERYLLLITPDVSVSTPEAFAALNAPRLTNKDSKSIFYVCRKRADLFRSGQIEAENDFEKTIFEIFPEIKQVKNTLLENGAKSALMSGSGASVFGIFDKEETRQATLKAIRQKENWRMFAVATVGRKEYRQALKMCR